MVPVVSYHGFVPVQRIKERTDLEQWFFDVRTVLCCTVPVPLTRELMDAMVVGDGVVDCKFTLLAVAKNQNMNTANNNNTTTTTNIGLSPQPPPQLVGHFDGQCDMADRMDGELAMACTVTSHGRPSQRLRLGGVRVEIQPSEHQGATTLARVTAPIRLGHIDNDTCTIS